LKIGEVDLVVKKMKKKTGLFFGSFNPIHNGHLAIAEHMMAHAGLDEVWFVVSPHNPLKEQASLLADHHRLTMVNLAMETNPRFRSSDIEFSLPRPSYTIDTLSALQEQHPDREFILIAGADTLPTLHQWKNYDRLLESQRFLIYPRPGTASTSFDTHPHMEWAGAPLLNISSTFIRKGIAEGKNVQDLLPERVWEYIVEKELYT
jgi:nicotinate-nucleotide adenylyltransferase